MESIAEELKKWKKFSKCDEVLKAFAAAPLNYVNIIVAMEKLQEEVEAVSDDDYEQEEEDRLTELLNWVYRLQRRSQRLAKNAGEHGKNVTGRHLWGYE